MEYWQATVKTINRIQQVLTTQADGINVKQANAANTIQWISPSITCWKTKLPVDSSDVVPKEKNPRVDLPARATNVRLLIGVNCNSALEPTEFLPSIDMEPHVYKKSLGWCTVGPICSSRRIKKGLSNVLHLLWTKFEQTTKQSTVLLRRRDWRVWE